MRGDELLSRLLHGEVGGGKLENCLLSEIQDGYPPERLRPLLKADDERIVAAGVWIASELGMGARLLLEDVVGLLHHPFFKVRFMALDCVLACARPEDRCTIAVAVDLIDDPHPAVVWQAMVFLALAPEALLRAVPKPTTIDERTAVRQKGLKLLVSAATASGAKAVASALTSADPSLRRYAAAAAARMVQSDSGPLKLAMESADPRIKKFANDMAARTGIPGTP